MKIKERLQSWPVWLALFGLVGLILNSFRVFERWGIDYSTWGVWVDALGSVLIGFGVLNNPTDRHNF